MKKNLGFSSFEFYFVVSVIGIILIVGFQRYYKLAQETQRLSFEILAQNFSASVYNYRSRWIIDQHLLSASSQLDVENKRVQFSLEGWPVAVNVKGIDVQKISFESCLSLWNSFLEKPPSISQEGSGLYGTTRHSLTVTGDNNCRYQWLMSDDESLYFEYSPSNGQIKSYILPSAKNG